MSAIPTDLFALLVLVVVFGVRVEPAWCQAPEVCANGIDDDADGLIDCDDLDCLDFSYFDSGQSIGNSLSIGVALGDLDGDGDLDAFVANLESTPNRVWLNDGSGNFTDSGQALGNSSSAFVALGDLDGDGDLDAFVANYFVTYGISEPNRVWFNDGSGVFTDSGQALGDATSSEVSLGDLDGDGDLDAYVANSGQGFPSSANRVWFNDGLGIFTESGQILGTAASFGVDLGDVDGDGDLDAWVANFTFTGDGANRVWFNDGLGAFTPSNDGLGALDSFGVDLGDLDGDGDLDAWVTNYGFEPTGQPNRIWFNDGLGNYTLSGQLMGDEHSLRTVLGDIDNDGDLDVWVTSVEEERVWLNDGAGSFTSLELPGNLTRGFGLALGDLDGDGDLDTWVGVARQDDPLDTANRVWINVLNDCPDVLFLRGDGNGDGAIDLADPVSALAHLFSGGAAFCLDAQDSNDDGSLNVADPVFTLGYLFSSGPPPLAPFVACGVDPTADSLDCAGAVTCP